MFLRTMHLWFPALLLLVGVALAGVSRFMPANDGWVLAYFPDVGVDPYLAASVAGSIAATQENPPTATLFAGKEEKRRLREAGAWLFHPEGVVLCQSREIP